MKISNYTIMYEELAISDIATWEKQKIPYATESGQFNSLYQIMDAFHLALASNTSNIALPILKENSIEVKFPNVKFQCL